MVSRWEHDDLASDATAIDRDEHRTAATHDRTTWVRVNGRRYDADRVPAREDVEDAW